jgi:hypothetical protein
LSKFFTVSDEAFAVTVLENYYNRWMAEGEAKAEGMAVDLTDLPPAKWTDSMCTAGKKNREVGQMKALRASMYIQLTLKRFEKQKTV